MQSRIQSDSKDRESVKRKIELCNDPLKEGWRPIAIVKIETKKVISYSAIIIDNILAKGKASIQKIKVNCSEGLNKSLSSKVKTMVSSQKHIKVSNGHLWSPFTAVVLCGWRVFA